jgi:tetratricopeptide (TPR) repeat protein
MDRKARETCAGMLAALVVILIAGCGAESVPPSSGALGEARPVSDNLLKPSAVEVARQDEPAPADTREDAAGQAVDAVVVEPVEADDYANDSERSADQTECDADRNADAPLNDVAAQASQSAGAAEPTPAAPLEPQDPAASLDDEVAADTPATGAEGETSSESTSAESEDAQLVATENVIRFAIPGEDAAAGHPNAAEDTGAVDAAADGEPAGEPGLKSGLKGVLVMPSHAPSELAPPSVTEQQPSVAEQQPSPTEEQPSVAGQQPAVQAPAAQAQQLPPVKPTRSPAMVATLARADERVRHGIQLAQKGALYAARREFTTAIKLIAQANDVEHGTRQYTKAAIAGFLALKEANDLVGQSATLGELDVARITAGHKTKVLDDIEQADLPPTVAAGFYYDYARQQLAEAIGPQTVGSIALYGLGKVIVIGAGPNAQQLEYTGPAIALYQAALAAEPENYRAAHELGVLLASAGQLEAARELLMASAAKSPQPVIWRNLAVLHSRMGERDLAAQAQQRADAMKQTHADSKSPQVDWVDPATFAATATPGNQPAPPLSPPGTPAATPTNPPQADAAPTESKANVARTRSSQWNPLNLRR